MQQAMTTRKPRLPPELLIEILTYSYDDVKELKQLSLVNKMFRDITARVLFRSISVSGTMGMTEVKLQGMIKGALAPFVTTLTVRGTAAVSNKRKKFLKTSKMQEVSASEASREAIEMGKALTRVLVDFFTAAKTSLQRIVLNFADEGEDCGTHYSWITANLQAVIVALGCVGLPSLSSIGVNYVPETGFRFFYGWNELYQQMRECSRKGAKFQQEILNRNLRNLTQFDVGYIGRRRGSREDITGSSLCDNVSELLRRRATNVKSFRLRLSTVEIDEEWYYVQCTTLSLLDIRNLVSLEITGFPAFGLHVALANNTSLRHLSLRRMSAAHPLDDTPASDGLPSWGRVFADPQLLNLKSLHADGLTGYNDSSCEFEDSALTWQAPFHPMEFAELIQHIIASGGMVTQGAGRERIRDVDIDLRLCQHDWRGLCEKHRRSWKEIAGEYGGGLA